MQDQFGQIRLYLAIIATIVIVSPLLAQDDPDPILAFYCERAQHTFDSRDPLQRGVSFSFRATTHYLDIGERGEVTRRDSSVTDFYYSFGQLDSSLVIVKPQRRQKDVDLSFPNVFATAYDFNFFPNDTGGVDMAIGFDTFDAVDPNPVGLAVIDRSLFSLRWLHLHYPNRQYYKRYSRSFRFAQEEGYVFADSMWEVSAKAGVFATEFFRTETEISDIRIYR